MRGAVDTMERRKLGTRGRGLLALGVGAALLLAAGCGSSGGNDTGGTDSDGNGPLKIGFAASVTGPIAPYDVPFIAGLKLGLDQINEQGGILGMQSELTVKDMRGDPALSGTVAQELIDEGSKIIVTPSDADPSIGAGQVGQRAQIPVIAAGATAPTLPASVGDYMFSSVVTDGYKAAALAQYAIDAGYKTAYTLGSPDTAYTSGFVKYFDEAYTQLGGKIVGDDTYKVGTTDFSTQVTKMQNASPQPDVIVTPAFMPDVAAFYKQLRAGVTTPVLGDDGNDTTSVIAAAGDAANGVVFTTHGFPTKGSKLAQVNAQLEATTGKASESVFTGDGWDLAQIIKAAFEKAGTTDGPAVRDALDSLKNVKGATSPTITYAGYDRLPYRRVAVVKIENGKFQLVKFIWPNPKTVPQP